MHTCRYETTVDGVISKTEFLGGLAALGLDFGPNSLNLDADQQVSGVFRAAVSCFRDDLGKTLKPLPV